MPERVYASEKAEDGLAVVLIPKFRNAFLAKWLMPRLKIPYMRVKLDSHGSFIWNRCDGRTSVFAMAGEMRKVHGPDFDPEYERIGIFIGRLLHGGLITVKSDNTRLESRDGY